MPHQNSLLFSLPLVSVGTLAVLALVVGWAANGQEKPAAPMAQAAAADEATFQERVQPLLSLIMPVCRLVVRVEPSRRVITKHQHAFLALYPVLKQVVRAEQG